jgi:hypothetical protein
MANALSIGVIRGPAERRDFLPLVRWSILMGLIVAGFAAVAYFGLIQLMLETDRTKISVLILLVFIATTVHCLVQTIAVSRELAVTRRVRETIRRGSSQFTISDGHVLSDGQVLEPCSLTDHIADLIEKSIRQDGQRVEQSLLLRALADRLRSREKLGWFVAEALLRLALLGTAVGFILMLIPIAGLTSFDTQVLRGTLSGMSGGMAIALNVTVTGISTALLLKVEYYFLDEAIAELFGTITRVTEVYVVPGLDRLRNGRE